MIKSLLLLTPIFVTFFWSILLNTDTKNHTVPERLLGKIMILWFFIFFLNYLIFIPFTSSLPIIEPIYQYAGLLGYPLFYIYMRLLTLDDKISLKAHGRYLLIPTILFLLYISALLFTPIDEYEKWVLERNDFQSSSFGIHYLKILFNIIRITLIIQIIATVTGNFILIKKYGNKTGQYYSDMDDVGVSKVKLLNWILIILGITAIVWAVLCRPYFMREMTSVLPIIASTCVSAVYSITFFILGWIGLKQKSLNPTFEIETEEIPQVKKRIDVTQKKILNKILVLFNEEKIYLDPKLTILDVANSVGTNRTYISSIINQQYDQNFCTFVNSFRVDELEKVVKENPSYSLDLLAESCGFGTIHSLKRAFQTIKQQPFPEWRKENID